VANSRPVNALYPQWRTCQSYEALCAFSDLFQPHTVSVFPGATEKNTGNFVKFAGLQFENRTRGLSNTEVCDIC
jgi:hypothetical protein